MADSEGSELYFCYGCMSQLAPGQTVCPVCGHNNLTRTNSEETLPEGTILWGKYLVGRVLGRGGFGITYIGYDLMLHIKVAIKEYFPMGISLRSQQTGNVIPSTAPKATEGFNKGRTAFQDEALTLVGFENPYVVRVRDFFIERGTAYIVMDFVSGIELSKEIERCGGRMPWERVLSLFKPLIRELSELHSQKIIHRDIKPANIKIVSASKTAPEHLVLLDFGAARTFVSENMTGTFTAMVTPGFAPLEQYSTKSHQGPYTDVYGICATMYAAITGEVPPTAGDIVTGAAKLKPISSFGIFLPKYIEKAIHHGLSLQIEDRTRSMQQLYDELSDPSAPTVVVKGEETGGKKKSLWRIFIPIVIAAGVFLLLRTEAGNLLGKPTVLPTDTAAVLPTQTAVPDHTVTEPAAAVLYNENISTAVIIPTHTFTATDIPITPTPTGTPVTPTVTNTPMTPSATNTPITPSATVTPVPPTATAVLPAAVSGSAGLKAGDSFFLGSYEQDNDLSNGAEPIEWQVLAVEDDRVLLVSRHALDIVPYANEWTAVTWETSGLRAWLNGEFYETAFSAAEKDRIRTVTLQNPSNPSYPSVPAGKDTADRLFLLSIAEIEQIAIPKDLLTCSATAFARAKNALSKGSNGNSLWWLRTPGSDSSMAAVVGFYGEISSNGYRVNHASVTVRPAMWISP